MKECGFLFFDFLINNFIYYNKSSSKGKSTIIYFCFPPLRVLFMSPISCTLPVFHHQHFTTPWVDWLASSSSWASNLTQGLRYGGNSISRRFPYGMRVILPLPAAFAGLNGLFSVQFLTANTLITWSVEHDHASHLISTLTGTTDTTTSVWCPASSCEHWYVEVFQMRITESKQHAHTSLPNEVISHTPASTSMFWSNSHV